MITRVLTVAVLLMIVCASAHAQTAPRTFTAFSPQTFGRATGTPDTISTSFNVPNLSTTFTLRVRNDGVSSASITLNGVEVVGPADFNQNVLVIERPVSLAPTNELIVRLASRPDSSITIEIVGADNDPPSVHITTPVDQTTVRTPAVTVTGTAADALSGLASTTCNGTPVVVSGGAFMCTINLVPGPNTIEAHATDVAGNTASATATVTFAPNHAPTADAGGPYSAEEGQAIAFSGSRSSDLDHDALTFAWDFGDGSPGTSATPAHLYTTTGTFAVTLTVSDGFGGSATATTTATVESSRPRITEFSPTTAAAGSLVTLSGSNFVALAQAAPQVTLARQGGGTIVAPITSFTSTSIAFVVPAGAASGPITVTAGGKTGSSSDPLAITARTTFDLNALPPTASVLRGQTVTYALSLNTASGFSQLAALAVAGLPSGLSAKIAPSSIGVGDTAVLTISAPADQPTGSSAFTVTADALVEGIPITRATALAVNIQPITTTFMGRTVVDDSIRTPLAGVTVTMLGRNGNGSSTGCAGQTVSDAAGNFALTNLAANCAGSQLVRYDGLTATSPPGMYAGVDLVYTIVANQVTVSPVLIHLPRLDAGETVMVQQNAAVDQVFTFKTIPNLAVRVYAGTTLTLVDGTRPNPFPLNAIEVPVDRLPDEMPPMPDEIGAFIVAFQPANTKASQPVAVTFPNRLHTPPGTSVELTTLDPTKGVMVIYGTGLVSNDGLQIIPDLDPTRPGKRYGLVNFDWHGPITRPPSPNIGPGGPSSGGSVDLASGIEVFSHADLALRGGRGSIVVQRLYRGRSNLPGPFGPGTSHNYNYRLDNNAPGRAAVFSLILPNDNRIAFSRQSDGALRNFDMPSARGVVMTTPANRPPQVRFRDGTIFRFRWGAIAIGLVLGEIEDPNGNVTTIRYGDNVGTIADITDPVGRRLVFVSDATGRMTSVTDPIGRAVRYTYDAAGRLEAMTDPEDGVTKYEYDSRSRLKKVIDPRNIVVIENTYDDNDRVIDQMQTDGGHVAFAAASQPAWRAVRVDPLVALRYE